MKVLIDTNVIIDALVGRQPYYSNADKIIKLCADKKVTGYMAAHSIPDIFYYFKERLDRKRKTGVIVKFM